MIEELKILRDKIDKLDTSLLRLLSKRLSLASQIGEVKNRHGLLIYAPEREKIMLASRRKDAVSLGLSPDLIEDIIRRIIRESYSNENKKGFKSLCSELRPIVIVGDGDMGRLFFKMFTLSGYQVRVLEKNDLVNSEKIFLDAGVVVISVPINMTVNVIRKLPRLLNDCILVDLAEIQLDPLEAMLSVHSGPVLGLHPMLNVDSESMVKQVIVYCDGRSPESYQWLLNQIQGWGAKLYNMNALDHDRNMSLIQSLCYFVTCAYGMCLFEENFNLKEIECMSSHVFRLNLIVMGNLFTQNPNLCVDTIMSSESNMLLIKRYYYYFGKLIMLLEKGDKKEFFHFFKKIQHWFRIYAPMLLLESRVLFRQINDYRE